MVANEMRSCQKGSEGSRCLLANQPTSLHLSTSPSKQRWQWQWWFCRFRVEIELCAPYMLGDTHHSSTHCLKSEKFLDQFLLLSHHRSRTGSVESTVRILVVGRRDTLWIEIRERFVFNTMILWFWCLAAIVLLNCPQWELQLPGITCFALTFVHHWQAAVTRSARGLPVTIIKLLQVKIASCEWKIWWFFFFNLPDICVILLAAKELSLLASQGALEVMYISQSLTLLMWLAGEDTNWGLCWCCSGK